MAKQIVFLRYSFMFDAVDTWQHLSQFEGALADFFAVHNMEARIVKTMEGQIGERIMIIERIEERIPEGMSDKRIKIQKPEENAASIKKGGKPLPKVAEKKIVFSKNKGRLLPQHKGKNIKLGGLK